MLLATCECTGDGAVDCPELLGQVMLAIHGSVEVYRAYGEEIADAIACSNEALAQQVECIEAAAECGVSTPAECAVLPDCPQPPTLAEAVEDATEACA